MTARDLSQNRHRALELWSAIQHGKFTPIFLRYAHFSFLNLPPVDSPVIHPAHSLQSPYCTSSDFPDISNLILCICTHASIFNRYTVPNRSDVRQGKFEEWNELSFIYIKTSGSCRHSRISYATFFLLLIAPLPFFFINQFNRPSSLYKATNLKLLQDCFSCHPYYGLQLFVTTHLVTVAYHN